MKTLSHEALLQAGRYENLTLAKADRSLATALYEFMLRLRRCEEALSREYHPADEMRCPVHFCIGQEAVPAALSQLLTKDDFLFSHHRSHGYFLAKGAPMKALFAELYGKADGANGGLAGSQDISYADLNFHSGAILTGATAMAAGAALGIQLKGGKQVAVAGFGESATDEGLFWETVNYAALRRLPVVLVCENNNYSVFSPQRKRQAGGEIHERVRAFGMRSVGLFGNDVVGVYEALREAVEAGRRGDGPTFIEAYTSRWSGHYGPASDDFVGYRETGELEVWQKNCPVQLLREAMDAKGWMDDATAAQMSSRIDEEIAASFAHAKGAPFPQPKPWASLNQAASAPLADALLREVELHSFNENQIGEQAKGY